MRVINLLRRVWPTQDLLTSSLRRRVERVGGAGSRRRFLKKKERVAKDCLTPPSTTLDEF